MADGNDAAARQRALGEAIRAEREALGLTQVELGRAVGRITGEDVPQTSMSRWEGGAVELTCEQVRTLDVALGRPIGTIAARAGFVSEELSFEFTAPSGGPTETFPLRALLVAMACTAMVNRPMLLTELQDAMFVHMSDRDRARLGIPDPPSPNNQREDEAAYRNVRTRFGGMVDVMDPSPRPKNRRLEPDEYDAAVKEMSDEEIAERHARLVWAANQILEASIRRMPDNVRRKWAGTSAIDATPMPSWARPAKYARRQKRGKRSVVTHSADPDAGYYVRDADHRDDMTGPLPPRKAFWAHELTLVTMAADDVGTTRDYPYMVVGMSATHRPGTDLAFNAMTALDSVKARGHPSGLLAADRAYNNLVAETFQLPARQLGYGFVFDYKSTQLGSQGSGPGGSIEVEGAYYCPSMPQRLIDATKDFRNGTIDFDEWQRLIEERRVYAIRRKQDVGDGHVRGACPAAGSSPAARCDAKPASVKAKAGKPRIFPIVDVTPKKPTICEQQSVTFPPTAGAKLGQELPYGTKEWHDTYATLRNTIEGVNGIAKDHAYSALGMAGRRRVHGMAAQTLFAAFVLLAVNIHKLDAFLAAEATKPTAEPEPRVRRSRRRTSGLGRFRFTYRAPPDLT
jgi:transcriptional regulator with XRE-family HTH domain